MVALGLHRAARGISIALSTYNHLNFNFGYTYQAGALIADDVPAPIPLDRDGDFRSSSTPGHSLPHAWLENTRGRYSINELVGRGRFLLIAGEHGQAWCTAARKLAARLGISLDALTIDVHDGDRFDFRCEWLKQREFGPAGAVLVRPDHFIAWRAMGEGDDPDAVLAAALKRILALV
ncbi:hypothetical protein FVF58_44440 [Paraburkholderia panacisoli]|uniref:2,4-dichlorophenol 6-monooxygenase n=1 Tax=Paraburkholderia panacisoli TaxID=2603818 RepID=A0A5B0G5M9_9BURK|nr:hypothetical protein [Paraburkholderia panacisoli]KAA0998532.1 hypothetical protein FVF58_44440 [Paraburkholderia panacisoli]